MTWFEALTGIQEDSPEHVRGMLTVDGNTLTSNVNGRSWACGALEVPTLAQLRERANSGGRRTGRTSVREVVADVQQLHRDEAIAGSMFQVASQFNLLEMVGPHVTPEVGVGIYENDPTQGPACAIAAGAGTIYRNYLAVVNGRIGQTHDNQIDCLADMGLLLGNSDGRLWEMRNGYALASASGLEELSQRLKESDESGIDRLRESLRIGVQRNTQVTLGDTTHSVSQAYCSALPVAYSSHSSELWEAFARLVLEAAYEATICAAIVNAAETSMNRLFLTLLGGGAFGNDAAWICDAICRAIGLYPDVGLDVAIVSRGSSNKCIRELLHDLN